MRFTVFLISILLFHPAFVYSDMEDIPAAVKSEIPLPDIEAKSWLLADFETGWVLGSKNADLKIEPASLTKLMTSFLVFTALQKNELRMEDMVYVSEKAWRTGGSKMFIQVDTRVSVEALVQGLIIQSGNDAAVALAEHIGGSEEGFASRMNIMAAKLGMTNSNFTNSSGLPDENHYSTAEDLVLLSIALIRQFPELYKFYSQHEFTYNGITQQNRNMLLQRDQTIDGIKTGHTKKAGYCLIGTGIRDGTRLVAAVTGSKSKTTRADQVQALLQFGYGAYDGLVVYEPGAQVKSVPLWMGETGKASIGVSKNLGVIFPKGNSAKLSAALELPDSLEAPITAGTPVGSIQVKYDGEPIYKTSLHVNEDYAEGPWYMRLLDSVKQLIF
jgi:D-alanyl-D-alanine carboxypeptidase (penicillin-binding protein 5/6)